MHYFQTKTVSDKTVCQFTELLFSMCPIVPVSLLIHWCKLWPAILSSLHGQQLPRPLSVLNVMHQWVESVSSHGKQQRLRIDDEKREEPWLLAVAMVTVIMEKTRDVRAGDEKMLKLLELILLQKDSLSSDVSCSVKKNDFYLFTKNKTQ